jgi:thiamine-phosphate pyrophosphorylase
MPDPDRQRLYLVMPVASPAATAARLDAALAAEVDVAAVLLRLAAHPAERDAINAVKAIAPVAQRRGIAVLVEDRPEIVARGGADGAHLSGEAALRAALPALRPALIAGAGALRTRHDAMEAAEAGADYVMFGEPGADGRPPPFDVTVERVGWWSEVFETPCVGFAPTLDDIAALAAAGADFVAVPDSVLDSVLDGAGDPAAVLRDAVRRLAAAAETAP